MDVSKEIRIPDETKVPLLLAAGLFAARLIALLSYSLEGLHGYGDFVNYSMVDSLPGWPFIHYWVEFPPIFPFLSELLYRLAGGQLHVFSYLLAFVLLLADCGSLILFTRLARRLLPAGQGLARAGVYLLVMLTLPYFWWYFDSLPVFFMLLGLTFLLDGRPVRGGLALGIGIATKFFPGLALLAAWKRFSWKRLVGLAALSLAPVVILYAILWLVSPNLTLASIRSQASKGSWETAWAMLDGNYDTGNFGPLTDRLDAAKALVAQGNPAVIPPIASLVVFGSLGLWALSKFRLPADSSAATSVRMSVALVGFAWCLFLLWSPGWSPQWVIYLLPLVLLVLPARHGYLFTILLVLVNLLEWPVLLSRGYFSIIWLPILLRTLLLAILALAFYTEMRGFPQPRGKGAEGMV